MRAGLQHCPSCCNIKSCPVLYASNIAARSITSLPEADRQEAIFEDDQDPRAFLKVLGEVLSRYRVQQRGSVPKLSAIRRQYNNRDEAMWAAYETGAYSYQQIAKEFGVHFTTVGRIVRQAVERDDAVGGRK